MELEQREERRQLDLDSQAEHEEATRRKIDAAASTFDEEQLKRFVAAYESASDGVADVSQLTAVLKKLTGELPRRVDVSEMLDRFRIWLGEDEPRLELRSSNELIAMLSQEPEGPFVL